MPSGCYLGCGQPTLHLVWHFRFFFKLFTQLRVFSLVFIITCINVFVLEMEIDIGNNFVKMNQKLLRFSIKSYNLKKSIWKSFEEKTKQNDALYHILWILFKNDWFFLSIFTRRLTVCIFVKWTKMNYATREWYQKCLFYIYKRVMNLVTG